MIGKGRCSKRKERIKPIHFLCFIQPNDERLTRECRKAYSECWIENVLQVDWHEAEEAFAAHRRHGVARVVRIYKVK